MKFFRHNLAAGAVSAFLLIVLLIGCSAVCAQTISAKSHHACCDPKGSCKPPSAEMKSGACESDAAPAQEMFTLAVNLLASPLTDIGSEAVATDSTDAFLHAFTSQRLTPLRI